MEKQWIRMDVPLSEGLREVLQQTAYDKLFVLTDENTEMDCLPRLRQAGLPEEAQVMTIDAGDDNKDVCALSEVWMQLSRGGATRHSLLINLGGGMVTDLGGFAAATFKRGIRCINIPTTLLAMVDAAVGGKTGINFNGLKNEVGVFAPAAAVLIDTNFLRTLDDENVLSGYAEMLKHGLISTRAHWAELLTADPLHVDYARLQELVARSVAIKEDVVVQDPYEKGLRKALNLGHTVGHAFESLALHRQQPVLHGYAVAWGLVCELYLSACQAGFPTEALRQTVSFVREYYGTFRFDCRDYDWLYECMTHDKKNTSGVIRFTLLEDVGRVRINQTATKEAIFEMLDFYREG